MQAPGVRLCQWWQCRGPKFLRSP
uniref:Uncharacterized protein n=1 Tax=Arundo donax TaxID=35708 RepID=A0A0A9AUL8_ARUDO